MYAYLNLVDHTLHLEMAEELQGEIDLELGKEPEKLESDDVDDDTVMIDLDVVDGWENEGGSFLNNKQIWDGIIMLKLIGKQLNEENWNRIFNEETWLKFNWTQLDEGNWNWGLKKKLEKEL